jgi:uncharacterized membrane protein YgcG
VKAIKVADIPTELDKQIQVLQRSASEHKIRQDEQLQHVKDLHAKLDSGLESLALSLEKFKDATTTDVATKSGQQAQLDASKDLQSGISQLSAALETGTKEMKNSMKVQKDFLLVIKTFLEEKAAIQERAIAEAEDSFDLNNKKFESSAWPSATLPAAHLAITLLSTIVSSVTVVSVVRQSQNAGEQTPMLSSKVSESLQIISSPTPTSTTSKTEIPTKPLSQSRALSWVSDFLSSTGYGHDQISSISQYTLNPKFTPSHPASTDVSFEGHKGDTGWSKKISKLDDSDSDSGGRENKERPRHHPDSTYLDNPGPVVPPLNEGLSTGLGHGRHSGSNHGGHYSGYSRRYSRGHPRKYHGGHIGDDSGGDGHSGGDSGGHVGGVSSGGHSGGCSTSDSDSDSD